MSRPISIRRRRSRKEGRALLILRFLFCHVHAMTTLDEKKNAHKDFTPCDNTLMPRDDEKELTDELNRLPSMVV